MEFLGNIFSGKGKQEPPQYPDVPAKIPFEITGDDYDRRRVISLINRIAENSPTGAAVLTEAAKHCRLDLSPEQESIGYASCGTEENPDDWRIALNPTFSDDVLTTTLVHESRHIGQFANGCDKYEAGMLDMKSAIMLDRAMEADADMSACMAALELAKAGDTKAFEAFEGKRSTVVKAVRATLEENPSASKDVLMNSAFAGWYDSDHLKTAYEVNYYGDPMTSAMILGGMDEWKCDREMSPALVAKKACLGGYLKDSDQLEQGKFIDLNPKMIKKFDKFFKLREMREGLKADDSYKACAVREPVKEKKNKKNKQPVDLSFLKNLTQHRTCR